MSEFDLEAGQVWDLVVNDEMRPCVLLFFQAPNDMGGAYWRCMDLYDGSLFSASLHRWRDRGRYRDELVGERLA